MRQHHRTCTDSFSLKKILNKGNELLLLIVLINRKNFLKVCII
jgi:hypothetical protein